MRKCLHLCVLVMLLASVVYSQQKPWSQWDKKDVEKMLNGSPWGQTQNETYADQLTVQLGTTDPNQAIGYNYRIRFFSARPIREAFARQVMLGNSNIKAEQLAGFINGDYSESIVVAVTFDGFDRRVTGPIGQELIGATTGTFKNKAYLERKDGKRVWVEEYAPPTSDNTGAKFVFPRLLDGKPFVTDADEFVRFVVDMSRANDINWKFKLADMKYAGKLEF